MRKETALDALNFSLAGAREGFGPFLGVYLQQQGFDPAVTGIAMGLAGLAGLLATTPIGALVDRLRRKRLALALAANGIAVGAVLLIATKSIWVIGLSQLVIGVSDTSVAPLVAALTLGLVGQAGYAGRVSRNEAFNHAGNAANAALAAALGYLFGLAWVAVAIVVQALASAAFAAQIDRRAIDYSAARGSGGEGEREKVSLLSLVHNRALGMLAGTVLLFETANGALLPFLAQARTAAGSDPAITTGVMTVVAQSAMVAAALLAARVGRSRGYAGVMSMALAVVAGRGLLAAFATSWALVIPVQVLEGVATGLAGVAIPALVAEIMEGTGQANAGLGGVMTAFGAGAAVSPILAGFVAQRLGFPAAFVALAIVAGAGLALWIVGRRLAGVRLPREEAQSVPGST